MDTITGNTARFDGGGIYCAEGSFPAITNNTIIGNSASSSGGGIHCYYSSATITNNIVAFNSSGVYRKGGAPVLRNNAEAAPT